ncbi:uncharacterized protein LOC123522945 [Mercenaria mercenaria]|uniref:uncharacterized protein LOC123522945 n=1 Tax=Mercenaria mercenaria TaxID=6596 RepID=UPI00234F5837|nr:uncharacterized protein LOC123522945 [Mercenaria mercenaria]
MTMKHIPLALGVLVIMLFFGDVQPQACRADCTPPDCSCPRTSYPMDRRDIPQMVYFGFDDAVNVVMSSLYNRLFTKKRKNPNGCTMKMTLFVSHEYTDYERVRKFYQRGMEIAVHSVTHTAIDDDNILRKEARAQKENLMKNAGVRAQDIVGWRSPFLKTAGNNQPKILKELGYEYDISLTYSRTNMDIPKPWPFTMDNAWPYKCGIKPCPTGRSARVKNFWAVPVVSLMDYKNQYPCSFVDGCAVRASTETEAFNFLWNNFMSYYNTTRTPFGLNMHAAWFYTRYNLKAMMRFLDELQKLDDVYVVTVKQMIDWMKNPTPVSNIHNLKSWGCPEQTQKQKGNVGHTVPAVPANPHFTPSRPIIRTSWRNDAIRRWRTDKAIRWSRRRITTTTTTTTPRPTTTTTTTTPRPTTTTTTTTPRPTTTTTTTTPRPTTTSTTTTTTRPTTTTQSTTTTSTNKPTTTTTTPRPPMPTVAPIQKQRTRIQQSIIRPQSLSAGPTFNHKTHNHDDHSHHPAATADTAVQPFFSSIFRQTNPPVVNDQTWWSFWKQTTTKDVTTGCVQNVNCHLPSCFCQGTTIPNNLKLSETPQMVYLTIDGSMNAAAFRRYRQLVLNKKNPNGCKVRGTFFASERGTMRQIAKNLVKLGAEVAMQGLHEHHYENSQHMEKEILAQMNAQRKIGINATGWKTPELKSLGNEQFRLLQKYGFKYDATLSENLPAPNKNKPWPYTLDFGYTGECVIPKCPTQSFPGLWEIPSVALMDYRKMFECSYVDGCMLNPPTSSDTAKFLWDNFMFNYKTNRAPFGIHLRQVWFSHPAYINNIKGIQKFISKILTLKDVYIVSADDIITWIQNPVPVSEMTDKIPWNCGT